MPGPGPRLCRHASGEPTLVAVFDDFRVGVVLGGGVVDVTEAFPRWEPRPTAIAECIADWKAARSDVARLVESRDPVGIDTVAFRPPVPEPRNLLGAPVNYHAHRGEVTMDRSGEASASADARSRGFFVKAAGSIVGPQDTIQLPDLPGREFAYEGEVAAVVGAPIRGGVAAPLAWDRVFGLTGFIDVTLRPSASRTEERSMRKSYHSFGPIGPWMLVVDGTPDVGSIRLELSVNGELRQHAPLSDLILSVPELLDAGSGVMPMGPGDVFATGTPSGVGPLRPGDIVTLHVCPIGEMSLPVVRREW